MDFKSERVSFRAKSAALRQQIEDAQAACDEKQVFNLLEQKRTPMQDYAVRVEIAARVIAIGGLERAAVKLRHPETSINAILIELQITMAEVRELLGPPADEPETARFV